MKHYWILIALTILFVSAALPEQSVKEDLMTSAYLEESAWVKEKMRNFTLEQKIGQLFMIRVHSNKGDEHVRDVSAQIKKYHVGGLCFFQGSILGHARLINKFQSEASFPLITAMDAEWGLGMRLYNDAISFPRQMTLGAIQNNNMIYQMGLMIGEQLDRLGIHINFAPVADINNNPHNPVINVRSFGEDRYDVAEKSTAYMRGLQDAGILACAKHFPGHGDTHTDSHFDLPVIPHDKNRLDSLELFPFKELVKNGVGSVMIAHLHIPQIDSTSNLPATLSPAVVDGYLRKKLGYGGLIITDGMEMKGVTKHFPPEEAAYRAIEAGSDIILLPEDIEKSFDGIVRALGSGAISQDAIDERVERILRTKYRMGIKEQQSVRTRDLYRDLHTPEALTLKRALYRQAVTLVKNEDNFIPIWNLQHEEMATLSLGINGTTSFQKRIGSYLNAHHYSHTGKGLNEKSNLFRVLQGYETVIVSLNDLNNRSWENYGVSSEEIVFVNALAKKTKVVVVNFGTPYILKFFENLPWLVQAYEEDPFVEDLCAQALCGAFPFVGRLPVSASEKLSYHTGVSTPQLLRLGYGEPYEVGMEIDSLKEIDKIMKKAIEEEATPGGQVLVAKNGKIVFHKSYGHHTYDEKNHTLNSDLFDLASVTKVAATTISLMHLVDRGLINLDDSIGHYLPEFRNTNVSGLILRDVLYHRAGLRPWIPFYEKTIDNRNGDIRPMLEWYTTRPTTNYNVPVADRLYLKRQYLDSIWHQIGESELRSNKDYKNSDLGFHIFSKLIPAVSGQNLDEYVKKHFYDPLGLRFTGFNPRGRIPLSNIVPTEKDKYFRRTTVHGYVHDFGAAMLGGVSGHAGLFSNANELAVIAQMLLNNGFYGGRKYFSNQTMQSFLTRHPEGTRRGLGFDMKELNPDRSQNVCEEASEYTFGHLGFTGTCVWMDPTHNLVYIFLSNRTYPSMYNYKLNKMNVRPRIQQLVYRSFLDS